MAATAPSCCSTSSQTTESMTSVAAESSSTCYGSLHLTGDHIASTSCVMTLQERYALAQRSLVCDRSQPGSPPASGTAQTCIATSPNAPASPSSSSSTLIADTNKASDKITNVDSPVDCSQQLPSYSEKSDNNANGVSPSNLFHEDEGTSRTSLQLNPFLFFFDKPPSRSSSLTCEKQEPVCLLSEHDADSSSAITETKKEDVSTLSRLQQIPSMQAHPIRETQSAEVATACCAPGCFASQHGALFPLKLKTEWTPEEYTQMLLKTYSSLMERSRQVSSPVIFECVTRLWKTLDFFRRVVPRWSDYTGGTSLSNLFYHRLAIQGAPSLAYLFAYYAAVEDIYTSLEHSHLLDKKASRDDNGLLLPMASEQPPSMASRSCLFKLASKIVDAITFFDLMRQQRRSSQCNCSNGNTNVSSNAQPPRCSCLDESGKQRLSSFLDRVAAPCLFSCLQDSWFQTQLVVEDNKIFSSCADAVPYKRNKGCSTDELVYSSYKPLDRSALLCLVDLEELQQLRLAGSTSSSAAHPLPRKSNTCSWLTSPKEALPSGVVVPGGPSSSVATPILPSPSKENPAAVHNSTSQGGVDHLFDIVNDLLVYLGLPVNDQQQAQQKEQLSEVDESSYACGKETGNLVQKSAIMPSFRSNTVDSAFPNCAAKSSNDMPRDCTFSHDIIAALLEGVDWDQLAVSLEDKNDARAAGGLSHVDRDDTVWSTPPALRHSRSDHDRAAPGGDLQRRTTNGTTPSRLLTTPFTDDKEHRKEAFRRTQLGSLPAKLHSSAPTAVSLSSPNTYTSSPLPDASYSPWKGRRRRQPCPTVEHTEDRLTFPQTKKSKVSAVALSSPSSSESRPSRGTTAASGLDAADKTLSLGGVDLSTPCQGVCWDPTHQRWVAHWSDSKTHQRIRKYFNPKLLGFERARLHAILTRKEAVDSGRASMMVKSERPRRSASSMPYYRHDMSSTKGVAAHRVSGLNSNSSSLAPIERAQLNSTVGMPGTQSERGDSRKFELCSDESDALALAKTQGGASPTSPSSTPFYDGACVGSEKETRELFRNTPLECDINLTSIPGLYWASNEQVWYSHYKPPESAQVHITPFPVAHFLEEAHYDYATAFSRAQEAALQHRLRAVSSSSSFSASMAPQSPPPLTSSPTALLSPPTPPPFFRHSTAKHGASSLDGSSAGVVQHNSTTATGNNTTTATDHELSDRSIMNRKKTSFPNKLDVPVKDSHCVINTEKVYSDLSGEEKQCVIKKEDNVHLRVPTTPSIICSPTVSQTRVEAPTTPSSVVNHSSADNNAAQRKVEDTSVVCRSRIAEKGTALGYRDAVKSLVLTSFDQHLDEQTANTDAPSLATRPWSSQDHQ